MGRTICILLFLAATTSYAHPGQSAPVLSGEKGDYLIGPLESHQWERFEPELVLEYLEYAPEPDLMKALAEQTAGLEIVCVLGTWCSDSRREVPRFWKVMDGLGPAAPALRMVGVGRTDAPEALEWEMANDVIPGYREQYEIEYVPTFIVLDGEHELGRIIETPTVSLEADLAEILGVHPSPEDR